MLFSIRSSWRKKLFFFYIQLSQKLFLLINILVSKNETKKKKKISHEPHSSFVIHKFQTKMESFLPSSMFLVFYSCQISKGKKTGDSTRRCFKRKINVYTQKKKKDVISPLERFSGRKIKHVFVIEMRYSRLVRPFL